MIFIFHLSSTFLSLSFFPLLIFLLSSLPLPLSLTAFFFLSSFPFSPSLPPSLPSTLCLLPLLSPPSSLLPPPLPHQTSMTSTPIHWRAVSRLQRLKRKRHSLWQRNGRTILRLFPRRLLSSQPKALKRELVNFYRNYKTFKGEFYAKWKVFSLKSPSFFYKRPL